jgi:hypothetical protein
MATAPYSAKVAAGGTATITIKTSGLVPWTISQVSVEMPNAPSGAVCSLRHGPLGTAFGQGRFVTALIPSGDVADGNPPVHLLSTEQLTVEWSGCTPNDIGKAYIFYDEGYS